MLLTIINRTSSIKNYLSGTVSVPGNSSLSITNPAQQLSLSFDGSLRADIFSDFIHISDGVTEFATSDAHDYLKRLGNAFNFAIDGSGNILNPAYNGAFIVPISIAPSVLTDRTNFWTMRNGTTGNKMFIMKIVLTLNYGGVLNSTSLSFLNLCRFSGATPSGGSSLSAIKTDTNSIASSILDARQSNSGLSMNSASIEGSFLPINVVSQSATSTTFNFIYPIDNEFSMFCLNPGEGITLQANGSLLSGCVITGFIQWVER